jgi:hypothetical protein
MYARSLAYDRDLDFTNDYALCGDPMEIGWITPAHRPANIFYIGPAVFWTPAIWLLKHVVHGAPGVAGGCVGPIPGIVLTMSSFAGAAVTFACSMLARRLVSPKLAALGALLATLGGHVIFFTGLEPGYSHAYDAMCVALYLCLLLRLRDHGVRWRTVLGAGTLLGLAVLQRSSNLIFFLVAVGALYERGATTFRRVAPPLVAIGAVAATTGLGPLLLANKYVFGRYTPFTHGPHFLHLAHAHPWLLVFDLRGGVFAWAPTLWLAVPGFVLLARRRELRWLVVPFAACGLFELWISSAALDWQGARRLTNLTPLAALGLALTLERIAGWLEARPRRLAHVSAAAMISWVAWGSGSVCIGFSWGKLPWDTPLTHGQRFGEGEAQSTTATESTLGALPVLPAAWLFALRYWRPPVAFGWAIHPVWYERDHHSLDYYRADFPFTAPEAKLLLRGFHIEEDKPPCVQGGSASVVFAAQWPFATRARFSYDASQPLDLSVGSRSILGFRTPWGRVALRPGKKRRALVSIPRGGFDSGINEVELGVSGPPEALCIRTLELVDDTRYPAAPEADASPLEHLWHAERYVEDGGENPSVALGSGGGQAWVAELHQAPRGQLAFSVTAPGELEAQSPKTLEGGGFRPSLAAAEGEDTIVEMHQNQAGPGALSCRMGHVNARADAIDASWQRPVPCGSGYDPAIAIGGGQALVLQATDVAGGTLTFRTGTYAGNALLLGDARPFDHGGLQPSVALGSTRADGSGRWVVEVHQRGPKTGSLWMRVGTLSPGGDVTWSEEREYAEGLAPSVVLFESTVVEAHQGQDDAGPLWIKTGALGADGRVIWKATSRYDTGARPALGVELRSGRIAEAHQGALGAASLWGRDGDLYRDVTEGPLR